MELDCDEEKASKVTSVGCVSTILAYRFEVSKEVDESSHCPYIAVAPASSAAATVNIVWGGKEDFKKTSAVEQNVAGSACDLVMMYPEPRFQWHARSVV